MYTLAGEVSNEHNYFLSFLVFPELSGKVFLFTFNFF